MNLDNENIWETCSSELHKPTTVHRLQIILLFKNWLGGSAKLVISTMSPSLELEHALLDPSLQSSTALIVVGEDVEGDDAPPTAKCAGLSAQSSCSS